MNYEKEERAVYIFYTINPDKVNIRSLFRYNKKEKYLERYCYNTQECRWIWYFYPSIEASPLVRISEKEVERMITLECLS